MSMDFDMKQLKRLPNGYKSKVIQTKKVFEKITENFLKSEKTFNGEILCDKRTGKYTLWPDCTVFTGSKAGNYGFVDNYKW